MDDDVRAKLESTATEYEARLVPTLFMPMARLAADAASVSVGQRVLDVACGTGALTREVLQRIGPKGKATGLDANPAMISVAGNVSPVMEWRHGQAEDLPFEDATFDVVVSQFGLNFFQDQQAALKEMSRVLVPSGNMVIAVFDSLVVNQPYGEIASIFERVVGTEVGEALRFPFGLGDPDDLRAIIETANVGSPAIKSETGSVTFPNVRAMVEADVFGWFPFAGIEVDEQTLDAVVDEATRALAPYVQSSGALLFEIGIHIASLRRISSE